MALLEYPSKLILLVLSTYKNILLTLFSLFFPWNLLVEEEKEDNVTGGGNEGNGDNGGRRRKNTEEYFVSETMRINRCHSYRSATHPEQNYKLLKSEQKIKELHEELAKVVNNLQVKMKANEALNIDLDTLRKMSRKLENTVGNLQDENEGLLENLKLVKKEREDYKAKEQETRKDLQLAKKERDEYKNKEEEARVQDENNKKVWKMRLDDMQKKQIKYKSLNKTLRETNDILMKKKIELEKEKTELATENYNLLTENANLEERVDELEEQSQERAVHKTFGTWLYRERYEEQLRNKDCLITQLQEKLNKLNHLMKSESYQSDPESSTVDLLSHLPVTDLRDDLPSESDVKPSNRPDGTPEWNENDLEKLENLMQSIKTTQPFAEQEEPNMANKLAAIVEEDFMRN